MAKDNLVALGTWGGRIGAMPPSAGNNPVRGIVAWVGPGSGGQGVGRGIKVVNLAGVLRRPWGTRRSWRCPGGSGFLARSEAASSGSSNPPS